MNGPETPERALSRLMTAEIEREANRLAFRFVDLRSRIRIFPSGPGEVSYGRNDGMTVREASFPRVMQVLAKLSDRDGSESALSALDKAAEAGRLRPRPLNVATHLQVGDRIGDATVASLTKGTTYDNAKNGRDVFSIAREELIAQPGNVIVGLAGGDQSYWRRASQIAGCGLIPTRGSRNHLPQLRRLHADLRKGMTEALYQLDKPGMVERCLAYHRMGSCVRTMLAKAAGPYSPPHAAERIFLDMRRRDNLALMARLPATFAGERVGAELRGELTVVNARKVDLGREMAEARPRSAAPSF